MAEIGIEKKKPVWPWIILVLVILAILYFLFFAADDNPDDRLDDMNNTTEQVDTTTWETNENSEWDIAEDTTGLNTRIDTTTSGFE